MKDNQPFIVIFAVLGTFVLVGIFCYTQLEIVPSTRWESPSREVRANPYYAVEKWLGELNCPARFLSTGNLDTILKGPEKTIFMETSRFTWNDDPEILIPWLKGGGRLIVSLDSYVNYQLVEFMKSLGVNASSFYDYDEIDEAEQTNVPQAANEKTKEETKEKTEEETDEKEKTEESSPSFDWQLSFKTTEIKAPVDRMLIMNRYGETKLVKLEIGKGELIFTGKAYFLNNHYLDTTENVNLAGELLLAADEHGILFIRGLSGDRQILGNLADRGNPAAMAVSIVLLVIAGFWMVIPSFGRYRPAPEKPGKPLRERFLAEGRFLKKNRALGKYIEAYQNTNGHKTIIEQLKKLNREKV